MLQRMPVALCLFLGWASLAVPTMAQIHTGGVVTNWTNPGSGTAGDLKMNSSGYGVVADFHDNQVIEIRPDGSTFVAIPTSVIDNYVLQLGPGAGNGSTASAIDNAGNVYYGLPTKVLKKTPAGAYSLLDMGPDVASFWADFVSKSPYYYALPPTDLAVDAAGNVYVSNSMPGTVTEIPADGSAPFAWSSAIGFSSTIYGITVDTQGRLYVCDPSQGVVQVLYPNSNGYTQYFSLPGVDMQDLESIAVDSQGNIYLSGFTRGNHTVWQVSGGYLGGGNPNVTVVNANVNTSVLGLAVDASDSLYVATVPPGNHATYSPVYVNKIDMRSLEFGHLTVTSPVTATAETLTFSYPNGVPGNTSQPVVVNGGGQANFQVSSWSCTSATPSTCTLGLAVTPQVPGSLAGTLELPDAAANAWDVFPLHAYGVGPLPVANTSATALASVASTGYVGVQQSVVTGPGKVVFANTGANSIQVIAAPGSTATTLSLGSPATSPNHATASSALNGPEGVAADGFGNIFIADTGNNRVLVYHAGDGTQLAQGSYFLYQLATPGLTLNAPNALATDGMGNLYISDVGNSRIVKVTNAGLDGVNVTTTQASVFTSTLQDVTGLAVDPSGNVWCASPQNGAVFELAPSGAVAQVVRTAGSISLYSPSGIAVDAAGDLYITDYVQPAGSGIVELTVGGVGQTLSTSLWWLNPTSISLDPGTGDLYVSVQANGGGGLYRLLRKSPTLSFATTAVNTTSGDSPQGATLSNIGNASETVYSASYPANFSSAGAVSNPCSGNEVLAPGANCTLPVSFVPTTAGSLSGTVQVVYGAAGGATTNIGVSGTAVNGGQTQTISFTDRASTTTYSTASYLFYCSATSGLPVTVRVISGPGSFAGGANSTTCSAGVQLTMLGAGTVVLEADQGGSTIYAPATPVRLSLKINPASLTLNKVYTSTEVYGSGNPVFSYLLQNPLRSGEQVGVVITGGISASTPVGTATITLALSGPSAGNYVLTNPTTTMTVTPAPLTVIAQDGYQLVGMTPTLTKWTVTGFVNGDTAALVTGAPTLTTTATASSGAGSYAITGTVGTVSAGSNYAVISFVNGVLNIFSPINMGSSQVGSSAASEFSFPAGASSPAVGGVALLNGVEFQDFTATGQFCQTPNAGTCSYQIRFTPNAAGLRSGAVELLDGSTPANVLVTIPVYGTGLAPQATFAGGALSTVSTAVSGPVAMASDAMGNLYIADSSGAAAVKFAPDGTKTTIGGGWVAPSGIAIDGAGNVYVADAGAKAVSQVSPSGVVTQLPFSFVMPSGLAVDGSGNLYVADGGTTVYKIAPGWAAMTPFGSTYNGTNSLAVDASGNLYVADLVGNAIFKVTPNGVQTTVTTAVPSPTGLALDPAGDIFVSSVTGVAQGVYEVGVNGTVTRVTVEATPTNEVLALALDNSGNLYITNSKTLTDPAKLSKLDRADAPAITFPTAGTLVGSVSAPMTVALSNSGNAALTFPASVSYPTAFAANTADAAQCTTSTSLAAGAGCDISILFAPTTAGAVSGSVVITDNSGNAPSPNWASQSISVQGTGLALNVATTTVLTASTTAPHYGDTVTFTATVAGAGAPVTSGVVTFTDGTTQLGSVALNGSGQAQISETMTTVATHSIKAVFGGSANFLGSNSAALSEVVARAVPSLQLVASTKSFSVGTPVTITLTAAPVTGGVQPTGSANLYLDGALFTTNKLVSGQATWTLTSLTGGTHTIASQYNGDTHYANLSASGPKLTVAKLATTNTLTSPSAVAVFGSTVSFASTISSTDSAIVATGNVVFTIDGVAQPAVAVSAGVATVSTNSLTVGSHSVSASYGGDTNFLSSASSPLSVSIAKVTSVVSSTPSATSVAAGGGATVTTTVAPAANAVQASGTITFAVDGTSVGTVALTNGQASWAISALVSGAHSVTASYSGDTNFLAGNAAPVTITAAKSATTVTLTPSATSLTYPAAFTATASVAQTLSTVAPSGSVTFLVDGSAVSTVAISSGTATLPPLVLAGGNHTVSASYTGDSSYLAESASAVTVTVKKPAAAPAVHPSPTPAVVGTVINAVATVAGVSGGSTPTGKVTFYLDGVNSGNLLLSGGTVTYPISGASVGKHTVAIQYNGDLNYVGSTSSAASFTITKASTTVGLTSSASPASVGSTVIFTATVSQTVSGVVPGGTVQFTVDGVAQTPVTMTGGAATLSLSTLAAGSHSIGAVYSGDANYTTATAPTLPETIQ